MRSGGWGSLPDVEAVTKYDGSPILKMRGSFMAGDGPRTLQPNQTRWWSGPNSRSGNGSSRMRPRRHLTDYYRRYPLVLVRLRHIDRDALRDLLSVSWRMAAAKAKKPRRREERDDATKRPTTAFQDSTTKTALRLRAFGVVRGKRREKSMSW